MDDLLIPVDPAGAVPLYQQIITGLEDAIADGHYDERPLPSTRRLGPAADRGAGEQCARSGTSVGEFGLSEGSVLALPLGDRPPARLELQPLRGRLGQPFAEVDAAVLGSSLDRIGELGWQGNRTPVPLRHHSKVVQR